MALPETSHPPQELDELDALFQDPALDEIIRSQADESRRDNVKTSMGFARDAQDVLDADDEIKITKKRAPIAKLDEDRLLSTAGIPKLRKTAKKRMAVKGKGHEFSDVALLLRTYQFWLDDMYPRAKFADGLSIIEKVGHSKRMQLARKEWIDESRPKAYEQEVESSETAAVTLPRAEPSDHDDTADPGRPLIAPADSVEERRRDVQSILPSGIGHSHPEEDELEALLAEESLASGYAQGSLFGGDHLQGQGPENSAKPGDLDHEDEEAVLREMEMDMDMR